MSFISLVELNHINYANNVNYSRLATINDKLLAIDYRDLMLLWIQDR